MQDLPDAINNVEELEELLSRPSRRLVEFIRSLDGDVMILGAGGKIGPSLTRMAKRAADDAGGTVIHAVDVVPLPAMEAIGVATHQCNLLDPGAVAALPEVPNIIYMAGRKFGSTGAEHLTWAMNVMVPANVAGRFVNSRIVVYSTGCVYPIGDVLSGGSTEETPCDPVGEYAMSCLGRERMFDYTSREKGQKVLLFRLNYAVEMRYGVLVDVAAKVFSGQPVDVTTGYANVLWQGDVCNQALLSLSLAASPPKALNVTGPETISIRRVAEIFGRLFEKEVRFEGEESSMAYLSDATQATAAFGYPSVPLGRVIEWTARWIQAGGENLGKPTHFETQDGKY